MTVGLRFSSASNSPRPGDSVGILGPPAAVRDVCQRSGCRIGLLAAIVYLVIGRVDDAVGSALQVGVLAEHLVEEIVVELVVQIDENW